MKRGLSDRMGPEEDTHGFRGMLEMLAVIFQCVIRDREVEIPC